MHLWKAIPFVALAATLTMAPGPAHAKGGKGACQADVQKFCADVQPGGGHYRDCLQQHQSELSPACQQHLTKMQGKMSQWKQACASDVQKLCSGVSGRGQIANCLKEHQDELSQSCKDQLAKGREHHRHAAASTK